MIGTLDFALTVSYMVITYHIIAFKYQSSRGFPYLNRISRIAVIRRRNIHHTLGKLFPPKSGFHPWKQAHSNRSFRFRAPSHVLRRYHMRVRACHACGFAARDNIFISTCCCNVPHRGCRREGFDRQIWQGVHRVPAKSTQTLSSYMAGTIATLAKVIFISSLN